MGGLNFFADQLNRNSLGLPGLPASGSTAFTQLAINRGLGKDLNVLDFIVQNKFVETNGQTPSGLRVEFSTDSDLQVGNNTWVLSCRASYAIEARQSIFTLYFPEIIGRVTMMKKACKQAFCSWPVLSHSLSGTANGNEVFRPRQNKRVLPDRRGCETSRTSRRQPLAGFGSVLPPYLRWPSRQTWPLDRSSRAARDRLHIKTYDGIILVARHFAMRLSRSQY